MLSAAEQVAVYLREQLARWICTGTMPGGERLSRDLGVGRMTVEAALKMLEDEGLLVPQGVGKRRHILVPEGVGTPILRIGILLYSPEDSKVYSNVDLQHRLMNATHREFHAKEAGRTWTRAYRDAGPRGPSQARTGTF